MLFKKKVIQKNAVCFFFISQLRKLSDTFYERQNCSHIKSVREIPVNYPMNLLSAVIFEKIQLFDTAVVTS